MHESNHKEQEEFDDIGAEFPNTLRLTRDGRNGRNELWP